MLVSRYGYRKNYLGEWTKKLCTELKNSDHLLLVKCDSCNKLYKSIHSNRNKRIKKGKPDFCRSCKQQGDRNPAYGKDRSDILAYARGFNKQNPMKGKNHSVEARKRMSERKAELISNGDFDILSNNRGYKTWYLSSKTGERFHADSALEHMRMTQLDNSDCISWTKRHKIQVPYTYNGVDRYCIPDFVIQYKDRQVVEEVKGRVTAQELAKKAAIEQWCKDNGYDFSFVTQQDLNKNGEYRKFLKERKNR